jgi:hypothetical protein
VYIARISLLLARNASPAGAHVIVAVIGNSGDCRGSRTGYRSITG